MSLSKRLAPTERKRSHSNTRRVTFPEHRKVYILTAEEGRKGTRKPVITLCALTNKTCILVLSPCHAILPSDSKADHSPHTSSVHELLLLGLDLYHALLPKGRFYCALLPKETTTVCAPLALQPDPWRVLLQQKRSYIVLLSKYWESTQNPCSVTDAEGY